MQLKNFSIILIVIFGFCGCIKNTENEVALYYSNINKAEINIIHEKYDSALEIYESAFLLYDSPWGLDYYNALLCSLKLGKQERAQALVDSCVKRGIEMDYLQNDYLSSLHKLFKQNDFKKKYDSIRQLYLDSFDTSVMKIFDFSFETDQHNAFGFMNQTIDGADYYDMVLANTDTLIQIIRDGKLPKYPYKYQQYPRMDNLPWITLRHYFGLRNSIRNKTISEKEFEKFYKMKRFYDNEFENLIKKQIQQGNINPVLFTSTVIYNHKIQNMYGENGYVRIREHIYAKGFSETAKNTISSNRNEIMLDSFEDYRIKYKYLQSISDSIGGVPMGMFRFRVNHHCVTHMARDNKTRDFLVKEFKDKGYVKL